MNRLQRAALLTELADKLREQGSWCGETHLQKATYFLQTLRLVPTGYDFILSKFGPFAFDLAEETISTCYNARLRPSRYAMTLRKFSLTRLQSGSSSSSMPKGYATSRVRCKPSGVRSPESHRMRRSSRSPA
jgi:hypothetical protein